MGNEDSVHRPVLLREVMELFSPRRGGIYVDGTVGAGGHAEAFLQASEPDGIVVGVDRDREILDLARRRLSVFGDRIRFVHGDFRELPEILCRLGLGRVEGILLDLGVSSWQILNPDRGFSFSRTGPLDMRMDRTQKKTAADLLQELNEKELSRVLRTYGEERWARPIARAITRNRPVRTTLELARIVAAAIPPRFQSTRRHPATKTFQALRIFLNGELDGLEEAVRKGADQLVPGGVLAVISFHSLEDRLVKKVLRELARGCICPPRIPRCVCGRVPVMEVLTPKPVTPSLREVQENPRSRSAKLRCGRRLPA